MFFDDDEDSAQTFSEMIDGVNTFEHLGFSIIVGNDDDSVDNADLKVRWCAPPKFVNYLAEHNITNPLIVISTYDDLGRYEHRNIYKINDVIGMARFHRAGKMNVSAIVIDGGSNSAQERRIRQIWNRRYSNNYEVSIQESGAFISHESVLEFHVTTVDIPDSAFGAEPSPWIKWFVNLWHDAHKKVEDQCEFRRRMILAFSIKWIGVLFYITLSTALTLIVMLGLMLTGLTSWIRDWKQVLHPFDGDWTLLFSNEDRKFKDMRDSRFIIFLDEKHNKPILSSFAVSPIIVLAWFIIALMASEGATTELYWFDVHFTTAWITLIIFCVTAIIDIATYIIAPIMFKLINIKNHSYSNRSLVGLVTILIVVALAFFATHMTWFVFGINLVIVTVIGLGVTFLAYKTSILDKLFNIFDKIYDFFDSIFYEKVEYTKLQELLCPHDIDNMTTNINSIPKRKRSFTLKFSLFKQKVCKPMQH